MRIANLLRLRGLTLAKTAPPLKEGEFKIFKNWESFVDYGDKYNLSESGFDVKAIGNGFELIKKDNEL